MVAATGRLLLDTCTLIWLVEGSRLADQALAALSTEAAEGRAIVVSPISAWERGMLVARRRLASPVDPKIWFKQLAGRSDVAVAELTVDTLTDASFLPPPIHKDPADRILIATARALDLTIVTRDEKILRYAEKGHVRALAC